MVEQIVDDGRKGNMEDIEVLGILLLEVGKYGLIFNSDGAHLLTLIDQFLQLCYLYLTLIHDNHYNQGKNEDHNLTR